MGQCVGADLSAIPSANELARESIREPESHELDSWFHGFRMKIPSRLHTGRGASRVSFNAITTAIASNAAMNQATPLQPA